jgi:hypothetical protein
MYLGKYYYVTYVTIAMIIVIRSERLVCEIMTNDIINFTFLYVCITILC